MLEFFPEFCLVVILLERNYSYQANSNDARIIRVGYVVEKEVF